MTLRRIAQACGGILHAKAGEEQMEISSLVTDSRQAQAGSLFAAIKGERVDGHRFIPAVFEQGALCVITERELPEDTAGNWIKVISTLQALKDIAEDYLRQLNIPVVGVTGSVGKTSTKEVIAAVLSQKYRTLKTQGNFNNELGLPLTVFRLREEDEMAVLEMGISDFGEMHRLAKIARPDTCVITNIGQCHLENLHDRDGILRAKTEIFDFLKPEGHIVLNGNDDKLTTVRRVNGVEPVFFGMEPSAGGIGLSVFADQVESLGLKGTACGIQSEQGSFSVRFPVAGRHMVHNALAAAAVGLIYGLTPDEIRQGIESLQPVSGRFHIIETPRYTIVDDCYNANPVSMKASLEVLREAKGRSVAILGDMGELGEREAEFHREVGTFAGNCCLQKLVAVGPLCVHLAEGAREANPGLEISYYETLDSLLEKLEAEVQPGDTVLVKASHFMNFPRIVEKLQEL